ncbi:bifunctional polysaccharide deacetylase/glycosyltransferase family 2 protein [Paenarthrobacter sp. DKR-5]|uniref:bifunctional polysaccharide deacetylase/glycosyltransferase family 2 protein n=1 Tax=Paenarthrobacter sp. DKR-5 TaxID=2835535 RepID=UPI0027DE973E|nr:bifunctional polysaccharide deacetylase/glycosyltransferase family 2 protein [Paenarthrobacter sp. DKR-5]
MIAVFAAVLAFVLGAVWVLPAATAPLHNAAQNQAVGYPRQLIASADRRNLPKIGPENGDIDRIDLVDRRDGRVFLKDPFSDTIFREATPDEVKTIGNRPYVVESYGVPKDKTLMLTFDDGPDPRNTPALLDLLAAEKVPATFFVVGEMVVKNPDIFKRIVREGHMVGNHTMTHTNFWANDDLHNRQELIGTDRVLRAMDNYATSLFRIPTGWPQNNALALLQAQQLGYLHLDADLDTLDWSYAPGQTIPVPKLDGKGHVVLMHDGGGDRAGSIAMLKKFIAEAKAQGYTFSTVQPLLTPQYVPQKAAKPVLADTATLSAMTATLVVPDVVVTWLFWFGIISLTTMSFLYIVLALVSWSRQRRHQWPALSDAELPFVSVVLPLYNEELVVAKTLDALRASDYPAFEVVAVNDGSTDNTLAVLREYARSWPQLRVLDQPNGGKSMASNNGIANSRGAIIVTLDGDTLFEPQTIRVLARHFVEKPSGKVVGAVAGQVKVGNRRNLLTAWQSLEYISGICVTRMAEGLVGAISIAPGACAAWRRDALLQVGGYSHDSMAEDADLTLSIQRLGYAIVQENAAVAWTEAPMTVKAFAKQRLRWTYGNIQALYKHRGMLFRSRYGVLGLVTLPYALISVVVPLIFMPMTFIVAGISLAHGEWQAIAIFAAFVAATHLLISLVAVIMVRESFLHLLIVPLYRLIYEPLRFYVVYGSIVQALRGRAVGWYRPERTNSVLMPAGAGAPARPDAEPDSIPAAAVPTVG